MNDIRWICRYCLDRDGATVDLERTADDEETYAEWHCPRCHALCAFSMNYSMAQQT